MSTETKPANPPAFPTFEEIEHWDRDAEKYRDSIAPVGGMLLRDYFAGKAIDAAFKFYDEGYCGRAEMDSIAVEHVGVIAYEIADAMLKAREQ